MFRYSILAFIAVGVLVTDASAGIDLYLDEFDDVRIVNATANVDSVKVSRKELLELGNQLLKLKRPDLESLLGKSVEKPAKTYAMPVGETKNVSLPGAFAANDNRPEKDMVSFHPLGDFAAVEVYYSRNNQAGDTPLAVRFYLKVDKTFPKLTKDNLDQRLAWEQGRLKKLAEHIGKGADGLPSPLRLMKAMDGFRKEVPPPQGTEDNGFGLKDLDGKDFTMSHLGAVARRLGVKTKSECLVLLTYLKDRDPKIRFIAAHAIEIVVHAYPGGMSLSDILEVDSDGHREMIRRFGEKIDKLAAEPGEVDIRSEDGNVLIAADQIRSYEWTTHTLTLAPKVRDELAKRLPKGQIVSGIPFVVAVGGKEVYKGRFTTCLSSISFSTPIVVVDWQAMEPKLGTDLLRIQLGYPTAEFFKGEDPRADRRIREALNAGGKLTEAESEPKLIAAGEWSKPVDDNRGYAVRGRLVLCEKRLGDDRREVAVYVELQDASKAIGQGMQLFCEMGKSDLRPEYKGGLQCEMHDKDQRLVNHTGYSFGGRTPTSEWVRLPSDATIRLRASPFGVHRAKAMAITPHLGKLWVIGDDDPNEYFLSGTFTVAPADDRIEKNDEHIWRGAIVLPAVRIANQRK